MAVLRRRGAGGGAAARADRDVVRAGGADLQRCDARPPAHVRAGGRARSARPGAAIATRRWASSPGATSPATARPSRRLRLVVGADARPRPVGPSSSPVSSADPTACAGHRRRRCTCCPNYDEYVVAYQDRSALFPSAAMARDLAGMSVLGSAVVLHRGRIAG